MDRKDLETVPPQQQDIVTAKDDWRFLWFFPHLVAVYFLARFCTLWLSSWTETKFLPLLQIHPSSSNLGFLFSHLLAFSFVPAFFTGLVTARFKHKAAEFVWIVPKQFSYTNSQCSPEEVPFCLATLYRAFNIILVATS